MESRIHREVYVRFGEGFAQTCRSNAIRRRFPTLLKEAIETGHVGGRERERQVLGNGSQWTEEPRHRRCFIACTDNLTGFLNAIEAVYPQTEIQNCVIHQLRNSSKYISYKDIEALMTDLKTIYGTINEPFALETMDIFLSIGKARTKKIRTPIHVE